MLDQYIKARLDVPAAGSLEFVPGTKKNPEGRVESHQDRGCLCYSGSCALLCLKPPTLGTKLNRVKILNTPIIVLIIVVIVMTIEI